MCRSTDGSIHWLFKGLGALAIVAVVAMGGARLAVADPDSPDANTCNANSELSYPSATNFTQVGDIVHIVINLGAGGIQGGTTLHVARVRFNLDCQNTTSGLNCADDGNVVSYQGNLTDTCAGVTFVTTHSPGDMLPNQVVFNYSSGSLDIPANTTNYCDVEFDVRVESNSNDGTPSVIEQVSGFDAATGDGVCNTSPPLGAGNTSGGSIRLCPICDDGNQCNGTETCDPNADPNGNPCVPGNNPVVCDDGSVCTDDSCDTTIPAPADPCHYVDNSARCNDNDVCTTDTCDPVTGCHNTPGAQGSCDDNNVCTTDTCDPINGCTHTPGAQGSCDDNNVCTTDTCDPINGCTHTPGAQGTCDDNDVCTTDTCDPINGCTHTPGAQGSCDDNNVCTTDTCDPINGCTHTPGAQGSCDDNNVCTTDTCDPTNGCTHTPGAQGSCDDNDVCTTDACDPITGCTHTPGAQGSCDDNNVCTTDACDPITGCTHTPGAQGSCDDKNVCTTDACDPITGCTHTPGALNCDDNNACTTDSCDAVTGCTHTPGALNCDDNNVCTTDSCDPVDGCVNAPGALNCDDNNVCTDDSCDPVDGCVNTDHSSKCDDGDTCTDDSCDPVDGCQHDQNDSCNLVCRTPGFWGTHADADPGKACSQDITGAVIELAGGSLSVCGECISNTGTGETRAPNDAASALEGLCIKVQGQQERQLARQLLSAALNCVMSGAGNTCGGTNVIDWATCNAVCQGTSSATTVGACITSIDNFNNGVGTGCHDRNLPLDTIFPNGTRCTTSGGAPVQGPAGSSDECQGAKGTTCHIIQPTESNCATDSCP